MNAKFKSITLSPSATPASPKEGMVYNDSTSDQLKVYINGSWVSLLPTAGADGREIELQKNSTHLQWRYVGETSWNDLMALSDVTPAIADLTQDSTHRFVTDTEKSTWNSKQDALGFTPENSANKGVANGYAPLDSSAKIAAAYLPSYVDDVLEYSSSSSFPSTGETGKIYVALNTNKIHRWSGSAYVEISPSPGSTDSVAEGSTNLYFTNARASSAAPVQSVAGKTGSVTLTKSDVALENVDNTSDLSKPISTATQTALDAKEPLNFIPPVQPDDIFRGYLYQQNSTSVTSVNITIPSTQGTATARSVASTTVLTKQVRMAYAVSTPAMDQQCGVRVAQALWAMAGGFKFVVTFAYTDTQYNSGARQFYGLTSATTVLGVNSTVTVASLLNIIGIGSDTGDTALSIYCNDGTGTATKTTLSATDFPANRTAGAASTDIFSLELYNAPASSSVKYRVTNVTTGVQATGTLSSDLPSTSTMLSFQAIRTSGSSSNACSMDLTKIGCYNLV